MAITQTRRDTEKEPIKKLLYQINIIIRYKYKAPIYLTMLHPKKIGFEKYGLETSSKHNDAPSLFFLCLFLCSGTHSAQPQTKKKRFGQPNTRIRTFCSEPNTPHVNSFLMYSPFGCELRWTHNLGTDGCHRILYIYLSIHMQVRWCVSDKREWRPMRRKKNRRRKRKMVHSFEPNRHKRHFRCCKVIHTRPVTHSRNRVQLRFVTRYKACSIEIRKIERNPFPCPFI